MYGIVSVLVLFQAWNIESCANLSLDGPVGQIYAMVVNNDILFAGAQVNFLIVLTFCVLLLGMVMIWYII